MPAGRSGPRPCALRRNVGHELDIVMARADQAGHPPTTSWTALLTSGPCAAVYGNAPMFKVSRQRLLGSPDRRCLALLPRASRWL